MTPLCLREGDNSNSKENTAIAVFPKPEEEIKAILARDTVSIGLLFEETAPKITAILQENPGTILQVEYLIRKLLGNDDRDHIEEIKPQLRSILVKGEKQKLWDSVPDAQNCWTIDLTLLPDYAPFDLSQLENLTVHSKGEIVLAAIDRVLKNAAPEPLSSNQIAQMLCPKKISLKQSKYFFKRVQSLLPNWSDRFNWKKLDRGVYLWVGNSTLRGVKPQKTPQ